MYQLYIRATPEQVWDAITNPETIAKYFHGAQVDPGPLEPGASRRSWSPTARQLWGDNTILECDPPRSSCTPGAACTTTNGRRGGEPGHVGDREQPGGFSKLTLVHDRLDQAPKTAASVNGWSYILSNIKTLIETGEPLPPIV